jgi:DNA-binding NarL/FixJ family response regulator
MIQILLTENHHLVRQGIRVLLEQADDMEVIAEAADGLEAVSLARQLLPNVVVMDYAMSRLNGIQALEQIRRHCRTTEVVILSMYEDKPLVRKALRLGAKGYILKDAVLEELLLAIRAVSQGQIYLSPKIVGAVLPELLGAQAPVEEPEPLDLLSRREREVLKLITEGYTNKEIAQFLTISSKTVEKHRASLMAKLQVHDLGGLIRIAIRGGLISLEG